ncbi:Rieske 2Fe-2S domain-containing protein [bacterium]|nr:Rieske 2Fe-2S domain-containing protein [bacterium]
MHEAGSNDPRPSRRGFLDLFIAGGFLSWLGMVVYPIIAYLTPPRDTEAKATSAKVPKPVSEFPPNSSLIFAFGGDPALVVRSPAGTFTAFYATCTHLDCTVQYRADQGVIWCACHNGKYDLAGKNVSGPPPRPLAPLQVHVRGDEIYVSREVS